MTKVIRMLAQLWSIRSDDPRAFEVWLKERGLKKELLSAIELEREQKEFVKLQHAKKEDLQKLVDSLSNANSALEFFMALHSCPSELKEVAYPRAISVFSDQNLIFVLVALSRESQDLIRACIASLPPSNVAASFVSYAQQRKMRVLGKVGGDIKSDSPPTSPVEMLLRISFLEVPEQIQELEGLDPAQERELVKLADHLIFRLPKENFGGFVRNRLAVFLCLSKPDGGHEAAREILVSSGDPVAAEVLGAMGETHLFHSIDTLVAQEKFSGKEALLSSLIDVARKRYPRILTRRANILIELSQAKNKQISLSAKAGMLRIGAIDEDDFGQELLRAVKSDRKGSLASWLVENSDLLTLLRVEKLRPPKWRELVETLLRRELSTTLRFIEMTLVRPNPLKVFPLWDQGLSVLSAANSSEADALFVHLVRNFLKENPTFVKDALDQDPIRTKLLKLLWDVLEGMENERTWNVIFDVLINRPSELALVEWLEESQKRNQQLHEWIVATLLTRFSDRHGGLSPTFLNQIRSNQIRGSVFSQITIEAVKALKSVKQIVENWPAKRRQVKAELAGKVDTGIRVALEAVSANERLTTRLRRISLLIADWVEGESPRMDDSLNTVLDLGLRAESNADRAMINGFFREPTANPHDIVLFFGSNPWAAKLIFDQPGPTWPSPDLLFEQATKSFSFLASLKKRAEAALGDLETNAKIDLAMAIRDDIEQIEEEIAGYLAFRDFLSAVGLEKATNRLGEATSPSALSSERHKLVRDPSRQGKFRIYSFGIEVGNKVVASVKVMRSGEENDRD